MQQYVAFDITVIHNKNNLLEENNIGYEYYYDNEVEGYYWKVRDGDVKVIENMQETKESAKSFSVQAEESIGRAITGLEDANDDKGRRDVVWQLVCAMESLVKILGENGEIKKAIKNLKETNNWGRNEIVKDALSIFDAIHRLYPDMRHGAIKRSTMNKEEAYYWIERICCYLRYMCRLANKNGIKPIC